MTISVLTNVASLNAQRNLTNTQSALAASVGRLSSGMRINTASDDAAGLGISENLKANIRSLAQAQRNANDGISMSQVAEGSMNEMQGIVGRMRELAVQSANSTLGNNERGYIQTEFSQLSAEINRIGATTEFNGQKLLDGSASTGLTFQVGIYNTANDRLAMSITKLTTSTLGSTSLHIASVSMDGATGVAAVSAHEVWLVEPLVRWSGQRGRRVRRVAGLPPGAQLEAIVTVSPAEGWAAGGTYVGPSVLVHGTCLN